MPQTTLTSFVTRRPVAILMVFLSAVVFGALSYKRLPLTLMPELSYPTLTVRTEYPGAAPEEVENDISRPIEEVLGVVGGLRRMSSVSRAGVSDVVLEFAWDVDMSEALQDTLEKLDLIFLPEEAERPLILRFDPTLDPVMELSLSGEGERFFGEEGLRRLRRIAELQIKRSLEPIQGVAAVRVRGGLEEEIHVLLDAQKLQRARLSLQQVIQRLSEENINVAGGTLKEGRTEYMVRTVNEYENLDQIRDTVIATVDGSALGSASGASTPQERRDVRVRDLGGVVRAHKEREILTRTDGAESVQLEIFKEADTNMVALAHRVAEAVGVLDLEQERARARGEVGAETTSWWARWWESLRPGGARPTLPGLASHLFRNEGAVLRIVADRSQFIEGSIREVRNTAVLGGLLAVLVLYLFLCNLKTTLIIAVSIPLSLLITFAPLDSLGVSLNIMSLGGLALGIGMLVDASIVVLESIFRCREEGDGLVESAVRGTREVRGAVVASILTSIAVFFPMVFVEGMAGQAFGDLGLAVVISLLASMGVALLFIPMLASRQGWKMPSREEGQLRLREFASLRLLRQDYQRAHRWLGNVAEGKDAGQGLLRRLAFAMAVAYHGLRFVVGAVLEAAGKLLLGLLLCLFLLSSRLLKPLAASIFGLASRPLVRLTESFLNTLNRVYPRLLRSSLAHPAVVLLLVAGILGASGWMLLRLETELLPEVHQGEFTVEVALPVGTPLEETDKVLAPVERAILDEASREARKSLRSLLLTVGYDPATSQRSHEGEHTARFKVLLEDVTPEQEERLVRRLRRRFAEIPDLDARIARPVLFSFKTPIEVEIHGDDLSLLKRHSREVEELLAPLGELADVESTQRSGAPEVQILYDRDLLARRDLQISQVAELVRDQVKGNEATLYNLKDRRIPIVVRLEAEDRRSTEDLAQLVVNPQGEVPIRLSDIAQVHLGEGPSEVRRIGSRRVALVRANLGEASLGTAVARIEEELTARSWPPDMTFVVSGQSQEWERSRNSLWLALALSVFLVYVLLAAQFESLLHPLVILAAIPLALVGTVLTLTVLEIHLSIVVFLGMILLAGIVVNNAIVLVDYINVLKRRGMGRDEAIVTAGAVRLRPILMTTTTTVLGLLPMALGLGDGAEIRTPMALAVIGGLLASTFLTLIIVPVLYALMDRLQGWLVGQEAQPTQGEAHGEKPGLDTVTGAPGGPVPHPESL